MMLGLASLSSRFLDSAFDSIVHGLKLLAVVVVADAALGMYNNFVKTKNDHTLLVNCHCFIGCPEYCHQFCLVVLQALVRSI